MLKIRLARFGGKKNPHYRVVVMEERSARNGRSVEVVGHYDPQTEPATIHLDHDRIDYWRKNGAQPTTVVQRLMKSSPPAETAQPEPAQSTG